MVLEEIHAGGGFEFGAETSQYLSLSLNQQQSAVMTKLLPPQTESESMKVETLCVILICSQQQVEVLQQQLIELRDHLSKQTSERQHSATVKAQEQVVLAFWKFFMKEEDQDKFCIWFCSSSRSWRKNWLMQSGKHGKQWVSLVLTPGTSQALGGWWPTHNIAQCSYWKETYLHYTVNEGVPFSVSSLINSDLTLTKTCISL